MLNAGEKLANLSVVLTDGSKCKLKELSGPQGLVVYFYPKDNTPGCTKEACSVRDHHALIKRAGYGIVGVSPDSVASHQRFTEKQQLNFPLIADEQRELCNAFGVWQEKKNYGKVYMGVVRSTFILTAALKVIKVYPKVNTATHGGDLVEDLKAL